MLQPTDTVSIVSYASDTRVRLALTPVLDRPYGGSPEVSARDLLLVKVRYKQPGRGRNGARDLESTFTAQGGRDADRAELLELFTRARVLLPSH